MLSKEDKATLLRKGNQAFNEGDIQLAARIFTTITYQDGLIRIADYYYTNKQPLLALSYYKLANQPNMITKINDTILFIVRSWLNEDKK